MDKISVVINTYNAEKFLVRVLESVKNFDEIVICDMESTDSTCEIAARYGCKIVTFPKGNHTHAEPARTFAIQSATSPWVLVIDADEIVTDKLRNYLYSYIARQDVAAGAWIPRKNYFMGRFMPCYYPDYILRFVKREGTVWPPEVHTMPIVKGPTEYIPRKCKELALIHLADDSVRDGLNKMNAYTENERVRRANKYHAYQFIYDPFYRFFKSYILKGGYRAGLEGFIRSVYDGMYRFTILAKIAEDKKRAQNNK